MKSEQAIQTEIRLRGSQLGYRLWRNNTGVATRHDGVPVRYGLCNESAKQNKHVKSSDLIGIRPVVITQEMVGSTLGQFVALEVKKEDWKRGKSDREDAQQRFINIVTELGGYACFINDVGDLS